MSIFNLFQDYRNIILLKIVIICVPVILILISKFSKKKGYEDLSGNVDYESVAVNLYHSFIRDIKGNKMNTLLKYCNKDIIMRVNVNNLNFPVYVYHKFIVKSEKFIEYLFVSFDQYNYVRRVILKIGKKNDKYMICGVEDER